MNYYKKPILNFAIIQPIFLGGLLALITLGVAFYLHSQRGKKKLERDKYVQLEAEISMIQSKIGTSAAELSEWEELLSADSRSLIDQETVRNRQRDDVRSEDFTIRKFTSNARSGSMATAVKSQDPGTTTMEFRGTYREIQRFLARLETKYPHLNLDSLKISSPRGNAMNTQFTITYTAWKK